MKFKWAQTKTWDDQFTKSTLCRPKRRQNNINFSVDPLTPCWRQIMKFKWAQTKTWDDQFTKSTLCRPKRRRNNINFSVDPLTPCCPGVSKCIEVSIRCSKSMWVGISSLRGQKVIILTRLTRDILSMWWNSGSQQLVLKSMTVTPQIKYIGHKKKGNCQIFFACH